MAWQQTNSMNIYIYVPFFFGAHTFLYTVCIIYTFMNVRMGQEKHDSTEKKGLV